MAQTLAGALSILGFSAEEEQTYRQVLPRTGQTLAAVAHGLERDPDELLAALQVFMDAGMVSLDHGHVVVATPGEAVASLLQVQTQEMRRTADRIEELRGAIPTFPFFTADPDAQGEPLGGELRTGDDVPVLLES